MFGFILCLYWIPRDLNEREIAWLKELETVIGSEDDEKDASSKSIYKKIIELEELGTPYRAVEKKCEKANIEFNTICDDAENKKAEWESIFSYEVDTPDEKEEKTKEVDGLANQIDEKKKEASHVFESAKRLPLWFNELVKAIKSDENYSTDEEIQMWKKNDDRLKELEKSMKDIGYKFEQLDKNRRHHNKNARNRIYKIKDRKFDKLEDRVHKLRERYKEGWKSAEDVVYNNMLTKMEERLKGLNIDRTREIRVKKEEEKPFILTPGQSELCIVAPDKQLADSLVIPLFDKWLNYNNVTTEKKLEDIEKRGVRYILKNKDGDEWKADVVTQPGDEAWNPHLSVSLSKVTEGANVDDAVCSDALVFFSDREAKALKEEEINQSKKKMADPNDLYLKTAVNLFRFAEPKDNTELLTINLYHKLKQQGSLKEKLVKVKRAGGGVELNVTDALIAQQLYAFGFHIRFSLGKDATKYATEFREYLKSERASDEIRRLGFVPVSGPQEIMIKELGSDKLPIQAIVRLMEAVENDKNVKEELKKNIRDMGYTLDGRYTVKDNVKPFLGVEIDNCPIFFDTKDIKTMKLDDHCTRSLEDIKKEVADTLAKLKVRGKLMVIVTGHADVRPSENVSNLDLSRGRARTFLRNAVMEQLKEEDQMDKREWKWGKKLLIARDGENVDNVYSQGDIIMLSIGCSDTMHYASKKENDFSSEEEKNKYYRIDRRVAVYIIVPKI